MEQPPAPLGEHLSGAGWTASPELDTALAPPEWSVRFYLRPDAPVGYLSAKGG